MDNSCDAAKYTRKEIDSLIESGREISFKYEGIEASGVIIWSDFNKSFDMAYGVVTIKEDGITFTTDVENIEILGQLHEL